MKANIEDYYKQETIESETVAMIQVLKKGNF